MYYITIIKKTKEWWQRFRQWQREPLHYKPLTDERHICLNCGLEFGGKFCPRCGQKIIKEAHVGMKALKDDFFNTFDIEVASLTRTFLHLLFRPGYLINDYLNGKRKVCTPPVNTLIMIGVVYMLLKSFIGAEAEVVAQQDKAPDVIKAMAEWTRQNPGWHNLLLCLFFLIPTWVLFRHSPCHTRHTLVEGFFIQVFMFILIMQLQIIFMIFGCKKTDMLSSILMPFYYMFALGPVFGYNWWSTLWRSVLIITSSIVLMMIVPLVLAAFADYQILVGIKIVLLLLLVFFLPVLTFGYLIGRYTARRRKRDESFKLAVQISPSALTNSIQDNDKPNTPAALREKRTGVAKQVLRKSDKGSRYRTSGKNR